MQVDTQLTHAIEALRVPVRVRSVWRDALLREIAAAPPPRVALHTPPTQREWKLRPAMALAAAAACVMIGVAAGVALTRSNAAPLIGVAPNAATGLTTVRFVIVAPAARQVSLVGDFNQWNVGANPMRLSRDGQRWVLEVPLAPGRHTYAFVVDGDVLRDPTAPTLPDDDFGMPNSIIFVADGRT